MSQQSPHCLPRRAVPNSVGICQATHTPCVFDLSEPELLQPVHANTSGRSTR